MIIVVGKIRANPDSADIVAESARRIVAATQQETGVIEYSFFQDPTDPRSFTILEVWSDAETFGGHGQSEHLAQFRADVYPVLEQRDVKVFDGELRVRR